MIIPGFLKKKRTYVILLITAAIAGYFIFGQNKNGIIYETAAAEKRGLIQTVEVTGEIKPAARIDLAFKNSGTIQKIFVKVGQAVKQGEVLAELKDDDIVFASRSARASLSIASANLNARLAGETSQMIAIAETQLAQAKAAYNKSLSDLDSTKLTTANAINVAEVAVRTAKNNLANQDASVSQNIQNSYDSARTTLQSALGPLQTGLVDGDQITAVDNTAANQNYVNLLGFLDAGSLDKAKASYLVAKQHKLTAEQAVKNLSGASSKQEIQTAGDLLIVAIEKVQTFLTDVQKVLAASLTSSYFTATDLTAKKTMIDADRANVSIQNSTVLNALQSIKNTELTKNTTIEQLKDAYETAETNLLTAKTNAITQVKAAETNVEVQKAAVDSALANLDLKKAAPRAVDVAGLRAAVEQAQVNYDKAQNDLQNIQITAPVDGTITEIIPDVGELIQMGTAVIRLVGTEQYDIEALVPEADIVKVEVGQKSLITLDAHGDDLEFSGTVLSENPDQTKVQDAIYYKIRVSIDPMEKDVKPGMTANVTVETGSAKNAVIIPIRAIKTENGSDKKTVKLKNGEQIEIKEIKTGLRGDEGKVQIIEGVNEGDQVVLSEKTK